MELDTYMLKDKTIAVGRNMDTLDKELEDYMSAGKTGASSEQQAMTQ